MGWNCRCPATTIKKHSKNCGKEAIQQEIRLIQFPFGNLPNAGPRIDPFDFLCRLDLTYWTYWDAASCHVVSINESEYPLGNESISHLGRRKIIIIDSKLIFQGICEFRRVWIFRKALISQNPTKDWGAAFLYCRLSAQSESESPLKTPGLQGGLITNKIQWMSGFRWGYSIINENLGLQQLRHWFAKISQFLPNAMSIHLHTVLNIWVWNLVVFHLYLFHLATKHGMNFMNCWVSSFHPLFSFHPHFSKLHLFHGCILDHISPTFNLNPFRIHGKIRVR